MLDAVLEHSCLSFTPFGGILLGTKDNRFRTIFAIDLVKCLVDTLQLLETLGIVIDEIGLYAIIRTDAHDNNASTLIMESLTEDSLHAPDGRLDNLLGGVGWSKESFLGHIPVLGQILTEMVGVDEDTDRLGHRLLLPEFLGTAGGKVGDAGAQRFHIDHHAREATGGTDALLLTHVLYRDAVDGVQLLPCTCGHDIV